MLEYHPCELKTHMLVHDHQMHLHFVFQQVCPLQLDKGFYHAFDECLLNILHDLVHINGWNASNRALLKLATF